MFEDSDLLQHDVLVLRATSPPDAQFSVLDETGREIGRVVGEGRLSRNEPAQLVLYDRQQTRVLAVERREENDDGARVVRPYKYVDGQGQLIREDLIRLKQQGSFFRKRQSSGPALTIRDARKAEVGSFAQALPPAGDHRLGVTFLFTITAEVTSELRLAALGYAVNFAEGLSRRHAWLVKQFGKTGQEWPGSAPEVLTR
jgi:hypothetical protein